MKEKKISKNSHLLCDKLGQSQTQMTRDQKWSNDKID